MKTKCIILLAALVLLAACAPGKPAEPEPTLCISGAPASAAPATPAPEALSAEAAEALTAILTDLSDNFAPGTAGSSLSAARLGGQLLDWYAEYRPASASITAAAEAFLKSLPAEMAAVLPEKLAAVYSEAASLTEDLLEAAGYQPQYFPWPGKDIVALFCALQAGIGIPAT